MLSQITTGMSSPRSEQITLKKSQRLKSTKDIGLLFSEGERLQEPSLMLIYSIEQSSVLDVFPIRAAFSVPKKKIASAVLRNAIKRQIKAAYCQSAQKLSIKAPDGRQILLLFVYKASKKGTFEEIQLEMNRLITKLLSVIEA